MRLLPFQRAKAGWMVGRCLHWTDNNGPMFWRFPCGLLPFLNPLSHNLPSVLFAVHMSIGASCPGCNSEAQVEMDLVDCSLGDELFHHQTTIADRSGGSSELSSLPRCTQQESNKRRSQKNSCSSLPLEHISPAGMPTSFGFWLKTKEQIWNEPNDQAE